MHANWVARNCLSQRLRLSLLDPQRRASRWCFSTSSRNLQLEPESRPQASQVANDELRTKLENVRKENRRELPFRKQYAGRPRKSRKNDDDAGLRRQRKPTPPGPDYVGQYVHVLRDRYVEDSKLPWYEEGNVSQLPIVRLNQEMSALANFLFPSDRERIARNSVIEDIMQLFTHNQSSLLQDFGLEPIGSEVNSLATTTSDLDFRLYDKTVYSEVDTDVTQAPRYDHRKRSIHALHQFQRALKYVHVSHRVGSNDPDKRLFETPVLLHARYPLVETAHRPTNIDVQIVCSNDPSLSLTIMSKYMREIPHIRTVYALLRRTLAIRGLADVFNGGIGSYTLFYMIVAALKHGPEPIPNSPSEILLHVLSFYTMFDSDRNWISIDPPQISEKTSPLDDRDARPPVGTLWPDRPYLLSIKDPADPTNDLPRQSFAWRHVKATFAVLRKELSLRLKTNDGRLLLVPFVGRFFNDVIEKREALLKYHQAFISGKAGLDIRFQQEKRPDREQKKVLNRPFYQKVRWMQTVEAVNAESEGQFAATESGAKDSQHQKDVESAQDSIAAKSNAVESQEQTSTAPAGATLPAEESNEGKSQEQEPAVPHQESSAPQDSQAESSEQRAA
ncbi:hypothetical protein IWX50DRAFT_138105 [Phyllosticta citricarpa]